MQILLRYVYHDTFLFTQRKSRDFDDKKDQFSYAMTTDLKEPSCFAIFSLLTSSM